MDVIIFRTLTRKSILGFGRFRNDTIQGLIDSGHADYLRFVYFYLNDITFVDDILKEIDVYRDNEFDFRINKPGANPGAIEEINKRIRTKEEQEKASRIARRAISKDIYSKINIERKVFSKSNLQRRNQNHDYRRLY
jgi:hypothetical protein